MGNCAGCRKKEEIEGGKAGAKKVKGKKIKSKKDKDKGKKGHKGAKHVDGQNGRAEEMVNGHGADEETIRVVSACFKMQ